MPVLSQHLAPDSIRPAPAPPAPAANGSLELLSGHLVVALVALVAVGGATRVMEAGLACPDWPLCYGVLLPGRQMNLQVFLEWFHRLDAFLVGLGLLALAGVSLGQRRRLPVWLPWASLAALLLVAFQGGLGALTVLQLLQASVVTAHLATALLLVALVAVIDQRLRLARLALRLPAAAAPLSASWLLLVCLAAALVFGQCVLGGLMASRWAAELCLQAGEGCRWLLRHRVGAWPAAAAVLALLPASLLGLPGAPRPGLRLLAALAAVLVLLQLGLGLATLRLQLSQSALTVGHQLTAALLIAVLAALAGRSLPVAPLPCQEPVHG
ncbi:MAG: COX15/CtaA family protein [Synechococcaceae cyanobacterium]